VGESKGRFHIRGDVGGVGAVSGVAGDAVSKNGLLEPFIYKKRTFYRDRLGTTIGKAQNKDRFSSGPVSGVAGVRGVAAFARREDLHIYTYRM
jgi:hypothetical protein